MQIFNLSDVIVLQQQDLQFPAYMANAFYSLNILLMKGNLFEIDQETIMVLGARS